MNEHSDDWIESIDTKLFTLESRVTRLEIKDREIEAYKRYLFPSKIKKYILMLNRLRNIANDRKFYPLLKHQALEVQEKMFNNQLSLESLLYDHEEEHIGKISDIISNQGLSGFNFLENLDLNLNLNKPILWYNAIKCVFF